MSGTETITAMRVGRLRCPVCEAAGGEVYARQTHPRTGEAIWIDCPTCRLVYQREFLRLAEMTELLAGRPEPYHTDAKIDDYELRFAAKAPGFRRRMKLLTSRRPSGGTIVEVGFGGGLLLRLLTESGQWTRVAGIEVARQYVLHAKRRAMEAYWADVTADPPGALIGQADLVVANEVMEHIEDPVGFLTGARRLLAPGGMIAASFAIPDAREKLRSSEWQYWRPRAVETLIERAGLKAEIHTGMTLATAWMTA